MSLARATACSVPGTFAVWLSSALAVMSYTAARWKVLDLAL